MFTHKKLNRQQKIDSFFKTDTDDHAPVLAPDSDHTTAVDAIPGEAPILATVPEEVAHELETVTAEPVLKKQRLTGGRAATSTSSTQRPANCPTPEVVRNLCQSLFDHGDLLHQHDLCQDSGCSNVSRKEEGRIDYNLSYKFQHGWLNRKTSFCEKTGIWWVVYLEGEGLYCTLCRKHDTHNPQNKAKTFNRDPCTRFRPEALTDHLVTQQHKNAVSAELLQRVSVFQRDIDDRQSVAEVVVVKAFTALYWIMKEEIPNIKMKSLLDLVEDLGMTDLKHFHHRSEGALREMFLQLGESMEESLLTGLQNADHYGLMVDEATDISVYEQMVSFVQFYDKSGGETKTAFLSVDNLLEHSASANSETITKTIIKTLEDFELDPKKLSSFVSDGASVMTGKNTGVAKRLKDSVNPEILNVHCICHRLALACTDTLGDINYIKDVQLWLVQLWKLFENSPKKMAVYLKTQLQINSVTLTTEESRKKVCRRLKKACQTRWLSFDESIKSIYKDYVALLQTLHDLKESDAAALGLLMKFKNVKCLGAIYILSEVLPHLATLSKTFQQGTVDFAQVGPSLAYTIEKLDDIRETMSPITKLENDLQPGGRLASCGMEPPTEYQIEMMKTLIKRYVAALKANLDRRFEESLPVLTSLAVLDSSKVPNKKHPEFGQYGQREVEQLAEHFSMTADEIDKQCVLDEMKAEFGKLKYDMLNWKNDIVDSRAQASSSTLTAMTCTLQRICQLQHFYPRLSNIADIVLSTPVSNAWPERGASAVKRIKTRLRSSLKNDVFQALLQVSINGDEPGTTSAKCIINNAARSWLKRKNRRRLPNKGHAPETRGHSHRDGHSDDPGHGDPDVITIDASAQTEAQSSGDLVLEEVSHCYKAFDWDEDYDGVDDDDDDDDY